MAPPKKRPQQKGKSGHRPANKPPQARKSGGSQSAPGRKPAAGDAAPNDAADKSTTEEARETTGSASVQNPDPSSDEKLSKSAEERKAKREAARRERIAAARKRQRAKRRKQSAIAIVVLVALVGGIWFSVQQSRSQREAYAIAAAEAGCGPIESFPDEGRDHLPPGESYDDYQTNPPTSGPHRIQPAPWGSYQDAPEQEALVHNLEHGGIVVHYKDLSDEEIDALDRFVDSHVNGVISAPNPDIESPIALAAWNHIQECERMNTVAIEGFIQDRCNQGPERVGLTCVRD